MTTKATNVVDLGLDDGRKEVWKFPDGTTVTMEVPPDSQPITIARAIYCFSDLIYRTHKAVYTDPKGEK